jgi:uncharacterized protein
VQNIIVDTGPLAALFDPDDVHHDRVEHWLKGLSPVAVMHTVPAVITETLYLLDFSIDRQVEFLKWVATGVLRLKSLEEKDHLEIATLMLKYRDRPMDFADACIVWLAESLATTDIASIDGRDFEVYRTKRGKKFNILPSS